MSIVTHDIVFRSTEPPADITLRFYTIDIFTAAVDTDTYLSAIAQLDDLRDEYTAESEVDALLSELVATGHTALHDPGSACPPSGWEILS